MTILPLYTGKAKTLFPTDEKEVLRMVFRDDATAFNAQKKASIPGKASCNNAFSTFCMGVLQQEEIKTHFIRRLSTTEALVKQVVIIPIEVVARKVAFGSLVKRLGIPEGTVLPTTLLELYYKSDALGDPLLNDEHVLFLQLCSQADLAWLKHQALRIFSVMSHFLDSKGIVLADMKMEFGYYQNNIILADEICPDICRLRDKDTGQTYDKDLFRFDKGDLRQGYEACMHKIGIPLNYGLTA